VVGASEFGLTFSPHEPPSTLQSESGTDLGTIEDMGYHSFPDYENESICKFALPVRLARGEFYLSLKASGNEAPKPPKELTWLDDLPEIAFAHLDDWGRIETRQRGGSRHVLRAWPRKSRRGLRGWPSSLSWVSGLSLTS
jgi:hypothetical protein